MIKIISFLVVLAAATPVPKDRWGILQPLAKLADNTGYHFNYEPHCRENFAQDLIIVDNIIFSATGNGIDVYRLPGIKVNSLCRPVIGSFKKTDNDFYLNSIAASKTENGLLLGIGIDGGMGILILNAKELNRIQSVYQDEGSVSNAWSVGTIASYKDSFLGVANLQVIEWSATAASLLTSQCFERSQNKIDCPGIFKGISPIRAVDISTYGEYVLARLPTKTELWKKSLGWIKTSEKNIITNDSVIWEVNGIYYAALSTGQSVTIYKIPEFTEVKTLNTPGGVIGNGFTRFFRNIMGAKTKTQTNSLSISIVDNIPYLWAGSNDVPGSGPQREYIFNLSNFIELTPKIHPDGYWGWYYRDNPTGFDNIAPLKAFVAKNGDQLLLTRSAWGLLDVHKVGEQKTDLVFSDNFETGNISKWN